LLFALQARMGPGRNGGLDSWRPSSDGGRAA